MKASIAALKLQITADPTAAKAGLLETRTAILRTYGDARTAVGEARAALEAAQVKAQGLARALAEADSPSKAMTREFGKARDAVNAAKAAVEAKVLAMQRLKQAAADNASAVAAASQREAQTVALRQAQALADAENQLQREIRETAQARAAADKNTSAAALARAQALLDAENQLQREIRETALAREAADKQSAATALAKSQVGLMLPNRIAQPSTGVAVQSVQQLNQDAQKAGAALARLDNAAGGFSKTRVGLESISTQLARIQNVAVSVGALAVSSTWVGGLANVSDNYTSLNNRIKLAAASQNEFSTAQAESFQIAQRNGQQLAATGGFYAGISGAIRNMGREQKDALGVTEAVAASIKVSGANASNSAAAMQQLTQALGSGVLRGDEFNSVMENAPRLAQALADGLGVPKEALREMAEAGKLSSRVVVEALLSQRETLESEAAAMDSTIGQALTRLKNQFTQTFGQNAVAGAAVVVSAIDGVTNNLDALLVVATNAATGLAVVFGTNILRGLYAQVVAAQARVAAEQAVAAATVQSAQASVASASATAIATGRTEVLTAAKLELAAAERAYAAASAGAVSRLGAGAIAALGGPVGAVTAAVMLGVTAWQLWGDSAEKSAGQAKQGLADLTKELRDFDSRMKSSSRSDQYAVLAEKIGLARGELKKLKAELAEQALAQGDIGFINFWVEQQDAVKAKNQEIKDAEAQLAKYRADLEKQLAVEQKRWVDLRVQQTQAAAGKIEQSEKESIERRIKEQEKLVDAVRQAWERTLSDVEAKRAEVEARYKKAGDYTAQGQEIVRRMELDGLNPEQRESAARRQMRDVTNDGNYASAQARNAAIEGNAQAYEKYAAQAETKLKEALRLAQEVKDKTAVEDISRELAKLAEAGAKVSEKQADGLQERAQSQAELLKQLEAQLAKLRQDAATLEIRLMAEGVQEKIKSIADELAALDGKTVTTTVVVNRTGDGSDVGPPAPDLPGRAYGGPLPGYAPSDRADNMIYRGTPGEWVIQRPAVRYYGADVLAAINAMRLPKFAYGGQLGQSMINRLQIPSLQTPAGRRDQLVPAVFNVGGVGRVPVQMQSSVRDDLARALKVENLMRGSGK